MIKGTEHIRIGDLIAQRKPFFVPIYQRTYAWEEEEIEDFIDDLRVIWQAQTNEPSAQVGHFFGGLVSVDQFAPHTSTGRRFEIVDGQQRLATFIITIGHLISAMERIALIAQDNGDIETERRARAYAKETHRGFLKYEEVEDGSLRENLRLRLSKADHVFYENLIDGYTNGATRESHNRLRNASDKIKQKLISPIVMDTTTSTREKLELLLQLRSSVTENCSVIHIVSDDRTEAYRLFRVLNDRGRTLSDGDKLRSHTLELLEGYSDRQDVVERHWDIILSYNQSKIDQFLRSYFASFAGERAPKRDLFDHFRQRFFVFPTIPVATQPDSVKVERQVANIASEAEVFSKISAGEWPYEEPRVCIWDRDRLSRLIKTLRHSLSIPLLLSACQGLGEESFAQLVNLIERFVFRYIIIVRVHPGKLADCYYKYAAAIRSDPAEFELRNLESDLRSLAESNAQDGLFTANLEEKLDYSQSSQRKIIRHFLSTIDDHYMWFTKGASGRPRADKTSSYDIDYITIEHIYPRNSSEPEEELESLKDNIGNLSIWAPNDNQAASNNPFSEKRHLYGESNIRLTRDLAKLNCWNRKTLMRRKESLVNMALKVFAI